MIALLDSTADTDTCRRSNGQVFGANDHLQQLIQPAPQDQLKVCEMALEEKKLQAAESELKLAEMLSNPNKLLEILSSSGRVWKTLGGDARHRKITG